MRRHLIGLGLGVLMIIAMFFAGAWGYLRLLRLPVAAGTPVSALPAAGGSLLSSTDVISAVGAVAATGLIAGILIAWPRISPLAAGLPGLVALAWTGLYLASVKQAVNLIPLRGHAFGAGWEAMLFNGVLGLAGLAMIIPVFVPSRWRDPYAQDEGALEAEENDARGYVADLKEPVGVAAAPAPRRNPTGGMSALGAQQGVPAGRAAAASARPGASAGRPGQSFGQPRPTEAQGVLTGRPIPPSGPRLTGGQPRYTGDQTRLTGGQSRLTGGQQRVTGGQPRMTGSQPRVTGSQSRLTGEQSVFSAAQQRPSGGQHRRPDSQPGGTGGQPVQGGQPAEEGRNRMMSAAELSARLRSRRTRRQSSDEA